jgi:hypothetical protein
MLWGIRAITLGMLLALICALVGCGAGGGESTDVLTRAEFMKKAKVICTRGTDRIDAVYSKYSQRAAKVANSEHFMNEAAAKIVIPVRREELRKLSALGLPAEGGRSIQEFLEALEEGIERGEENHPSVRAAGEPYAFERAYELAGHHVLGSCFRG